LVRFPAGRADDGAPPTLDSTSPGSGPQSARGPHPPARHPMAASLALGDSIRPFQAHHLPIPWRSTFHLWHGVGRGRDASCCAMVTFALPSVPPSPSHRIAPPIRPGSRNKKGPSLPSSLAFAMAVATVHGRSATSAEKETVNTDRDGRQTDPSDPCRIHRVVRTGEKRSDVLDETRFLPAASVHARVSTTRIRPMPHLGARVHRGRVHVLVRPASKCNHPPPFLLVKPKKATRNQARDGRCPRRSNFRFRHVPLGTGACDAPKRVWNPPRHRRAAMDRVRQELDTRSTSPLLRVRGRRNVARGRDGRREERLEGPRRRNVEEMEPRSGGERETGTKRSQPRRWRPETGRGDDEPREKRKENEMADVERRLRERNGPGTCRNSPIRQTTPTCKGRR